MRAGTKQPRLLCPRCGREVAVRKDGRLRRHHRPDGLHEPGWWWCRGSLLPVDGPTPDEKGQQPAHFHGCPTPTGRLFDCDYCQDRAASMESRP